jgi:hypothetical protein
MRRILKLFQDLDNQVTSIQSNVTEIINIANFSCNTDETNALMTEYSSITAKPGRYNIIKDTINSVFTKIEFERLESSSCSEDTNIAEKAKIQSDEQISEVKRYESLSLRPQYHDSANKAKLNNSSRTVGYTTIDYQYQMMRELYSLTNIENRYVDYVGLYPRLNYAPGASPDEI